MCISNPKKVLKQSIPRYGYKLMQKSRSARSGWRTPYQDQELTPGQWEFPSSKQTDKKIRDDIGQNDYLHHGRFSVFVDKKDLQNPDVRKQCLWLVQITSNTAFAGSWNAHPVMLVDSIRLVKIVKRCPLWKRIAGWLEEYL